MSRGIEPEPDQMNEGNGGTMNRLYARRFGYPRPPQDRLSYSVVAGSSPAGLTPGWILKQWLIRTRRALYLRDEEYDFIVRKAVMSRPAVQAFLEILRSEPFRI
ncbi:MAG TPA: hypothetical protein VK436_07105 [Methanocella sp.]|nr:hypothetical protein [Methanocella sp.]